MPIRARLAGGVARDAFFVLAIPIIGAVEKENGTAVGLDELALGVVKEFAGSERLIHGIALVTNSLSSRPAKAKHSRENNPSSNIDT